MRTSVLLAVLSVAVAAATAHDGSEAIAAKKAAAGSLFAVSAGGGELDRIPGKGGTFRLVLRDPDRVVTRFTDRPARQAGHLKLASFVRRWRQLGFQEVPPNAALVIAEAPDSRDILVVELLKPRLRRGNVVFTAKVLKGSATGALRRFHQRADRRVAATFGELSLFIDPSGKRVQLVFDLVGVTLEGFALRVFEPPSATAPVSQGDLLTSGPTDLSALRTGFLITPKPVVGPDNSITGVPIDANVSVDVQATGMIEAETNLPRGASATVTVSWIDEQRQSTSYTEPIFTGKTDNAWPTDRVP